VDDAEPIQVRSVVVIPLLRRAAFWRGYTLARRVADADVHGLIDQLKPRLAPVPLIRLGGQGDGGYLVPDDLAGIEYCFSPGVSATADFESALADRNIRSFLADYSVERPPLSRPEFVFDRKFIGAHDDGVYMTLRSWKERYLPGYQGELLLQMDIEGAEYEVILNSPAELLRSFRIIVMELHDLERLFDPFAHRIIGECLGKLSRDFYVVHAHPNNCSGLTRYKDIEIPHVVEVTLYNRSRGGPGGYCERFPHPLDADNCRDRPPLILPRSWQQA
jgi:hypothetical protein